MGRIGIIGILLLSAILNFSYLERDGLANLYYAAGVKSMMMSSHNFFFVSFDPGGFITIDKPPFGFWLQTLSAKIFGFKGWSLILPQALGGVISVYLIYILVKRYNGLTAGLISALTLALTPIFVAASRNNTIDGLLSMTLLFAAYMFLPAVEEYNLKRLLLAFFLMGVGFNIKSLEAFTVLPSLYLTYLFARQGMYKKKIIHLITATVVLIISSLPWFVAVDSIAPQQRPYVGSSENDSELELAIGYNGLGHFLGYGSKVPGQQGHLKSPATAPSSNSVVPGNSKQLGTRLGETGAPSPFRLFNRQVGGQIGWLLPLALVGVLIAIYQRRRQIPFENGKMALLFWSCWLVPQIVFFSIAQGFHRYYLVVMTPGVAALAGISYSIIANWITSEGKKRYVLPITLLITLGTQLWIILQYNEWRSWMLPLVLGTGIFVLILLSWLISTAQAQQNNLYRHIILSVGMITLLIAPFAWSITPVLYGAGNPSFPFAGPDLNPKAIQSNTPGLMPNLTGMFMGFTTTSKLENFLLSHRAGEKYLVAVPNAHIASPLILDTEQPVMTYGGFMGSEKILDAQKLEELVATKQVRYIIIGSEYSQQPEIDDWISSHGILVPDSEWQTPEQINRSASGKKNTAMKLFECHP
jgi:4-amino-4-deoxy-L-arabinose transferase-like glycosyltransferase